MAKSSTDWMLWDEIFTFAIIQLSLSPAAFWALSLPELRCLIGPSTSQSALWPKRDDITDLMARFPDHFIKEASDG